MQGFSWASETAEPVAVGLLQHSLCYSCRLEVCRIRKIYSGVKLRIFPKLKPA